MVRTRVKICGVCRAEDAVSAVRGGADAVGVVQDPSAGRYVPQEDAKKILASAPFVTTVGLFVNSPAHQIKSVLSILPFSAVQLHGDESPELVAELKPIRVIKAIHLRPGDATPLRKWRDAIHDLQLTNIMALLIESEREGPARGA